LGIENLFSRNQEKKKRIITLEDHAVGRRKARRKPGMFYLGRDLETGDPIFLSDEARKKHMHIVGGSGSGKTSFMNSMTFGDLECGRGLVYISGKGDTTTRDALYGFAKFLGREKDFRYFSLIHPELSHRWSPFVRGSATQVKDKLIGSILWSEPYYKKTSEDAVQTIMMALFDAGMRCTFQDLDIFLSEKESIDFLLTRVKNPIVRRALQKYQKNFEKNLKEMRGFSVDISLLITSEFGQLFDTVNPDIDFIRAYEENQIVYIELNVRGLSETCRRIGRMLLKDLAFASDYFDTHSSAGERKFFPCFVDELDSFYHHDFGAFASQSRSSGFALTLGHQSLSGNLKEYGPGALNEIIDNTNISVLLTQRANESVEQAANISGTKKVVSESYQTEEKQQFLMAKKAPTGQGNIFLKNEYNIDPNAIRSLQTGEAYCVVSEPPMQHLVMLNYVPPLPLDGDFPKIEVKTPEIFDRIPLPNFTDPSPAFKKAKVRKQTPAS